MRGTLRPGQERRLGRDRLPGAVRGRLGDGAPGAIQARPGDHLGSLGGHRRLRPRRPHGRRRAGQEGPRRDRLRGVPRGRRRAHLRNPRVPAPQGHRPAGGGPPRRRRREDRDERDHRTHVHPAGAARPVRCRVPRSRGRAAGVHERSGRELQGRLLGQRVPDPGQPDGCLEPGVGHTRPTRPPGRGRGRRERRDRLRADRQAARRRRGDDRLPARHGRAPRPRGGGPPRRAGRDPLRAAGRAAGGDRRREPLGHGDPVHPDGAGRARRVRPAPPHPDRGLRVRDRVRDGGGRDRDALEPAAHGVRARPRPERGGLHRHRRARHVVAPRGLRGRRHRARGSHRHPGVDGAGSAGSTRRRTRRRQPLPRERPPRTTRSIPPRVLAATVGGAPRPACR